MLPNFIVAGVEKTGSTSLYNYLSQHPDVFMCTPKEPDFFVPGKGVGTIEEYKSLFEAVRAETAVGEASVGYFHSDGSADRIKQTIPEATIIVILRDPADRAFSHYNMLIENGVIPNRPFIEALRDAKKRGDYAYTGIPTSRYCESLNHYMSVFDRNLCVHKYSDYRKDAVGFVKHIFSDIGVDSNFLPDLNQRFNKTRIPKSGFVNQFVWKPSHVKRWAKQLLPSSWVDAARRQIVQLNREVPPPLSPEARRFVIDILREDIEKTEELTGFDLSGWKR